MTVRPITTPETRKRAFLELTAAVNRLAELPACHLTSEFTEDCPPGRARELVRQCHACPVFDQCRALADLLPARDKGHTVTAGVRYDGAGRPVDLRAEIRRLDRDEALLAAVELKAAS